LFPRFVERPWPFRRPAHFVHVHPRHDGRRVQLWRSLCQNGSDLQWNDSDHVCSISSPGKFSQPVLWFFLSDIFSKYRAADGWIWTPDLMISSPLRYLLTRHFGSFVTLSSFKNFFSAKC
jgi:hypothetical protein